MVADQPLILNTDVTTKMNLEDGEVRARYNLRKLSELPYHLIRSEMWNEFVEVCDRFFFLPMLLFDNKKLRENIT